MEQGSRWKVDTSASWGTRVPSPGCFKLSGSRQPATLSCHSSGRQRGAGVPDPGCLAQALTGQGPFSMTSEVLGSSPWLFEPILAGQTAARRSLARRPGPQPGPRKITKTPTPARVRTCLAGRRLRTETVTTGRERCFHTAWQLRESSLAAKKGESLHLRGKQERERERDKRERESVRRRPMPEVALAAGS